MPFDGNGNWTSPFFPIDDRDNSVPILASKFDTLIQSNLKQSFANCMTIDSQTKPITNLDFNNFKGVNVADPTLPKDVVNKQTFDNLTENNIRLGDSSNIAQEINIQDFKTALGFPIDYTDYNISIISTTEASFDGSVRSNDDKENITSSGAIVADLTAFETPQPGKQYFIFAVIRGTVVTAEFDDQFDGSGLASNDGKRRVAYIFTDGTGSLFNQNLIRDFDNNSLNSLVINSFQSGTTGHIKLQNGLILQWGSLSSSGSGYSNITFPIAFPSLCFQVQVTINSNGGALSSNYSNVESFTTTGANIGRDAQGSYWLAIGI